MAQDKKEVRLTLISAWLQENYLDYGRLRHNMVTDRVQVAKDIENTQWHDIEDTEFNSMLILCAQELQRNIAKSEFETVLFSNIVPMVHPLRNYILSLQPYEEGEPDWIAMKADEVTLLYPEQRDRFCGCLRKWLISMVACWMDDTKRNDQVLVLIGPQGIYKTTWLESLLPKSLRMYQNKLVLNGMGKVDDDVRNMLYENALINMDELDAMNNSELNQVKSLITAQEVNNRGKYQRFKKRHVRIASFCGSTNKTQFLTDLTGSRRWLPFEVTNIQSPFDSLFPLDRMFAQAYHDYQRGVMYWFDKQDIAIMEAHNEEYRMQESEEELLKLWFDTPAQGKGEFMTAAEISDILVVKGGVKKPMPLQSLSVVMKRNGFLPTRITTAGRRLRGFWVYKRTEDEVKLLKESLRKESINEETDAPSAQGGQGAEIF